MMLMNTHVFTQHTVLDMYVNTYAFIGILMFLITC